MKTTFSFAVVTTCLLLSGCAVTGGLVGMAMCGGGYCASDEPEKYQVAGTEGCEYNSISNTEYQVNPEYATSVQVSSMFDPNRKDIYQTPVSGYDDLKTRPFKIVATGVSTVETTNNLRSGSIEYQHVSVDGKLYRRASPYYTKVVTDNCSVYYLEFQPKQIRTFFSKTDGLTINDTDIRSFYGDMLSEIRATATIEYDRFEKLYKVSTPVFDGLLLRGAVKETDGAEIAIQAYTSAMFLDDWGNISRAIDSNGESLSVTVIKNEPDCTGVKYGLGCTLEETVGVNLTREYLERNINGIEIKLAGQKEKIIEIPSGLIKSLLNGLAQAQSQRKS